MAESLIDTEAGFWKERFTMCKTNRTPFEEQWYTNYAFYKGRQWVVWDRTPIGNRLIDPVVPQNRVRLVSNKIKPIIRRETAKLTNQEPVWYVMPNTSEPADVAASKVAEALSEYILSTAHFGKQRRLATFWTSICGTGFLKTGISPVDNGIEITPPNPWQVYVPELQTEDIEDQPYVIIAKAMNKNAVETQYDIELSPTNCGSGGMLEQRFFSALGIKNPSTNSKDLVAVLEIWTKPGMMKDYPKGGLMVVAGDKLAYKYHPKPDSIAVDPMDALTNPVKPTLFPYKHGEYPLKKMESIPSGGFYGISVIEDLIPLQKERNKTRSQMIEAKNRTSNPKLAYTIGAIDPQKVTSQAGQFLPVKPGFDKPAYIESSNDQMKPQEIEFLDRDMDDVSSQSEISKGAVPPGVQAASAISYLQEQADLSLHYTIQSIADCIEGVGRQALQLAQEFWPEDKIVQIVSKNNTQNAMLFSISDIKDNTDLRIQADSIAPQSRAAKQAFITGLMKDQVITNVQGLRYLDMAETTRLYDEAQVDNDQARRENMEIATQKPPENQLDPSTGQPVIDPETGTPVPGEVAPYPVNPYDNHPVHIFEHGLYMKSQEYELLDQVNRSVLLNHWLAHRQAEEQDIARAAQLQSGTEQQGVPGYGRPEQQSGPEPTQ